MTLGAAVLAVVAVSVSFATIGYVIGYYIGARRERRRTLWIFDCARAVVMSGALNKVRRAVEGEFAREQMQAALRDEV